MNLDFFTWNQFSISWYHLQSTLTSLGITWHRYHDITWNQSSFWFCLKFTITSNSQLITWFHLRLTIIWLPLSISWYQFWFISNIIIWLGIKRNPWTILWFRFYYDLQSIVNIIVLFEFVINIMILLGSHQHLNFFYQYHDNTWYLLSLMINKSERW